MEDKQEVYSDNEETLFVPETGHEQVVDGITENEKVHVLNLNNGERIVTYVIKGIRGSGDIFLNGAAARKVIIGDVVIIMSFANIEFQEAKSFKPAIIFPDTKTNKLI